MTWDPISHLTCPHGINHTHFPLPFHPQIRKGQGVLFHFIRLKKSFHYFNICKYNISFILINKYSTQWLPSVGPLSGSPQWPS